MRIQRNPQDYSTLEYERNEPLFARVRTIILARPGPAIDVSEVIPIRKISKNYNPNNPLPPVQKIESEVQNSDMSCWQPSRIRWRLLMERFLGTPDTEPNRTARSHVSPRKKKKKKKNVFIQILGSFWCFL